MNSESQTWVTGRHGQGFDPDKLLTDVGGWKVPATAVNAGRAVPKRAEHYCSFCWIAIPDGEKECASCGRTLTEIIAHEKQKSWTGNSDWNPAQQDALSGEAAVLARQRRLAAYSAVTTTARAGVTPATLAIGLVVLLVVGGGIGAIIGSMSSRSETPNPSPSPQPTPPPVGSSTETSVTWVDPYPELRLELVDEAGKTVASSKRDGESAQVKPGRYRLRTVPEKGFPFQPVERQITLDPGRTMKLATSASAVGDFYAFRGIRLQAAKRSEEAERAWKLAVDAQPDRLDVRLSLAELYISQGRRADAEAQITKILELDPTSDRGLKLQKRLP